MRCPNCGQIVLECRGDDGEEICPCGYMRGMEPRNDEAFRRQLTGALLPVEAVVRAIEEGPHPTEPCSRTTPRKEGEN